jgi:excisionase family DNA binding protein
MRRLLNITELSRQLGLAKGTIYNWVCQRRIPFIKLGRALRFDSEEVEQIVKHVPKEPKK